MDDIQPVPKALFNRLIYNGVVFIHAEARTLKRAVAYETLPDIVQKMT